MGENIIFIEQIKSLSPVIEENKTLHLTDSHLHLDMLSKKLGTNSLPPFSWTWSNADYRISYLVSNYCYPRNWPSSKLRSGIRKDERIQLTFGIHPRIVELENTSKLNGWISDLEWMLKVNRVVAVGECGLDNSGKKWDVEKQIKFKKTQIVIAVKGDVPLVIHCKGDARPDEMCLNALIRLLPKQFKLHRHCFHGDEMLYQKWKTSFPNCKFGISSFILNDRKYPKCRSLVCNMELNDIVLETDAQYLHSELEEFGLPFMIKDICEKLANIFLCSVEEIASITTKNAAEIYNII